MLDEANEFLPTRYTFPYGLASAVLYAPRNHQDGQCSKSIYAYQSNPNVLHRSVAVSGELGKISDPIRLRACGFLSSNCSGKLLFEFPLKNFYKLITK